MATDIKDREAKIARGEFTEIIAWLRDRIHRHGRTYSPAELCHRATGKPLDSSALMRHLDAKVAAIYR
jgi:carboxypeptidase Taq